MEDPEEEQGIFSEDGGCFWMTRYLIAKILIHVSFARRLCMRWVQGVHGLRTEVGAARTPAFSLSMCGGCFADQLVTLIVTAFGEVKKLAAAPLRTRRFLCG